MTLSRRGFLIGVGAAIVAPAIVRPGLIMPIKPSLTPMEIWSRRMIVREIRTECNGIDQMKTFLKLVDIGAPIETESLPTVHLDESRLSVINFLNEPLSIDNLGFSGIEPVKLATVEIEMNAFDPSILDMQMLNRPIEIQIDNPILMKMRET